MDSTAMECPVCRMPKIIIPGDGIDQNDIIKKSAEQYRQMLIGDLEIGVIASKYRDGGAAYVADGTQYVSLFQGSALSLGDTVWSDYKFGQGRNDQEIRFNVRVKKGNQVKTQQVIAGGLNLKNFWYVGINLKEGFEITLQIGNQKVNVETTPVSLLF